MTFIHRAEAFPLLHYSNKRALGVLSIVLLFVFANPKAVLSTTAYSATSSLAYKIDSIQRKIPLLRGEERLVAYSNICRLSASGDDLKKEIASLYRFINEADRQKKREYQGSARSMLIMCYYNNDLSDSLYSRIESHLEFMKANRLWDYYYNIWDVKVEELIYRGKIQTALNEAKAMYDDASKRKIRYGLGISTYIIGYSYQTMERYHLAKDFFTRSMGYLEKEDDISMLLSLYNVLGETLDQLKEYENMLSVAQRWERTLNTYKKRAEAKGKIPSLNGRYMYCWIAYALGNMEQGHMDKAEHYLRLAEECAKGRKPIARFKLMYAQSRYYEKVGNYSRALALVDSTYTLTVAACDSISALTMLQNKARILNKMGNGTLASELYEEVAVKRDSIRNLQMAAQLDELQAIFSVDTLLLQKKKAFTGMVLAIVGCFLLTLLLITFFVYNRRLKNKNRHLYEIMEQNLSQKEALGETPVPSELSKEEELFNRLKKVIVDEHLYTNPNLDRKELAAMLSTNEHYLAEAIRTCAGGLTVGKFLNVLRAKYAGRLLISEQSLSVEAVALDSGFTSRSSFYRAFKDYYGMTPAEFISISKEKKRSMSSSS